ncbi:MAG: ZIP family metal transporter [Candidatus Methanoperedens sp.]|nr:ZIP family metal transporter [Candidatus Methanoperedens sp.]MCZ7359850.1 ZIP family metal transporter [Candidatus Methanoperedens sp.]HLB69782.1 ZIP family metal transporter [Candidatus Methanoperedens sp.]
MFPESIVLALLATGFTWGMTALGAAAVFLRKDMSRRMLDSMLGFAGGVMIAASIWSLLIPAIEMSQDMDVPAWLPAALGFLAGGIFLGSADKVLPHLHLFLPQEEAEGIRTPWRKSTLLILAITLHNIPEGLAIGVAFGAVSVLSDVTPAVALAIGIGIQNFPEGLAVSMPLRREGMSRLRSFWYGQLSGVVEPVAAVIGAVAVVFAKPLLPYALGFAAGAMIFVVVEEVIPESQRGGNHDLASMGAMAGFVIMMVLDVAFG